MAIHAIVMPIALQGHVIPAVQLALKLASNGFTITFVNTQKIHQQITNSHGDQNDDDIFVVARESGLDIRYRTVNDGFPLSFDRVANREEYLEGFMSVLPRHVDELVGEIVRENDDVVPVSCLVADTFFPWQSEIAEKYGLVFVSFWTETALVYTLYYHMELLEMNGHFGSHENCDDIIDYIPGVSAIEPKDLPSYLQEADHSTTMHKIIRMAFKDVKRTDFILCNTIQELESDPILALQEKQPFFSIGPLFPSDFTKAIDVPTSLRSESDCTKWLDTKTRGSVLYISFGSYAFSEKDEIDEIAHGLALSRAKFIWVLRLDAVSHEEPYVLPIEIQDTLKQNGLIVTWTNQNEVLSHPSIGGFLTHCGWNSVLESVWYGLPMLCFPLMTDQITNRRLVVDDWNIGLNLCDDKPLTRFEVAAKINRLMSGKSTDDLRRETMNVRQVSKNALDYGSSQKNLVQFISHVKAKVNARTKV